MPACDYLIIGGGVIGLSVARELKLRRPDAKITLIEKEASPGEHASGRNSGVIHSGIYYTADSLKARLTKEGNAALVAWCGEKKIPVRRCGKLIVARTEADHPMLDELVRRGAANGVEVQDLSEEEVRKIEPRAKTVGRALFVASTASADPRRVVAALAEECRAIGVEVRTATKYLGLASPREGTIVAVRTSGDSNAFPSPHGEGWPAGRGRVCETVTVRTAGFVVNCAGLYADKIARDFGFSRRYAILPFKGLYLESPEPPESLRCHVYPVPSKTNPFLGVHATVRPDGHWKIGPTAIPALWRENYGGLERFDAGELAEIAFRQMTLLFGTDFDFRRLAWEELKKHSKRRMLALAAELVDGVSPPTTWRGGEETRLHAPKWVWGTPGIRAQLVALRAPHPRPSPRGEGQTSLVNDFVLEGDSRSLHVLNAVSPAFTCCLSFAKFVADQLPSR